MSFKTSECTTATDTGPARTLRVIGEIGRMARGVEIGYTILCGRELNGSWRMGDGQASSDRVG